MSPDSPFQLRIESDGDRRVIWVAGNLTIETAAHVREALSIAIQPCTHSVVETSGLTKIDLSGLQLLYAAGRSATGLHATLELSAMPAHILETARAAGFPVGV